MSKYTIAQISQANDEFKAAIKARDDYYANHDQVEAALKAYDEAHGDAPQDLEYLAGKIRLLSRGKVLEDIATAKSKVVLPMLKWVEAEMKKKKAQ